MSDNPAGPVHPGQVLREDFLKELGLSAYEVAKICGVPGNRLYRLIREEKAISADTALRLGAAFGTTPQFWMNLQSLYDLDVAREKLGKDIRQIKLISDAA